METDIFNNLMTSTHYEIHDKSQTNYAFKNNFEGAIWVLA